jgi:FkbM family methyltransferase
MIEVAVNWPVWILRQLLRPVVSVPVWIRTRAGTRFHLGADPVDDTILRHVMRDAVEIYFPAEASVPRGALILDVGAHHGIYATEMLRRNPGAHLIAVEPNPDARAAFERNLRANHLLARVEYVSAGLGERDGRGFLAFADESWERSTTPPFGDSGGMSVALRSVTDVLGGRHPYLVKLNAEGAEFEVVPEMLDAGIRPEWIVLLMHPPNGDPAALKERIARAGYEVRPADGDRDSTRLHCRLRQ